MAHRPAFLLLAALAALGGLALSPSALAQDPPAPPGGFPIVEQLNQLLTYSDGYRTRYDLRRPDPTRVTPPPDGWPCLLLVHGFSGARGAFTFSGEGSGYASLGYVTIAYDVRGQGDARALNPGRGTQVTAGPEKADMAELFHLIEARLGGQMDFDRLAVMGTSQGGDHAWAAAAWSEQLLPQPRGSITNFPKIIAACPRAGTPDFAELWNPDGEAFAGNFTRVWFRSNAVIDPSYRATLQQLFLNQDFAGLRALLRNDPWRQDLALLPSSTVAVFQNYSWDDFVFGENRTLDGFNAMPASTPRLCYLSTGIHQTPRNQLEDDYADALTERWLARTMKGFADEIDQQPRFLMTNIPADAAVANSASSVWQLRQSANYPGTGLATPTIFYLRQGSSLSATPPAGNEPSDRVVHQVQPGFTPSAWVQTDNDSAAVFAAVPLSQVVYRGVVLSADTELLGRASARIHVRSEAPNLQLHVVLFDEAPNGQRRYITGGYRCVRGRAGGNSVSVHDVELRGTSYVFRAGHRIVAAVENHVWHRPLGVDELRTVPYLNSYAFECLHDATRASSLTLPLSQPLLGARADQATWSIQAGPALGLPIRGAAQRAGQVYAMLVSFAGTVPGFAFAGQQVPLNFDGLTQLGLSAPTSTPFSSFIGTLDPQGNALAGFVPAPSQVPASLAGARLSFAAVTFAPGGGVSVSAPSQVTIVP